VGKVSLMGGLARLVDIGAEENVKPRIAEPEGDASCSGEKIDRFEAAASSRSCPALCAARFKDQFLLGLEALAIEMFADKPAD
jgi:hypothetical protein